MRFNFLVQLNLLSSKEDGRRRQWHPTPVLLPGNPMDGGAWQAAVHGVAKSRARLSDFTFTFQFHALEKEMATHSSVLAWRIPGMGSLVGCCLWGRTESDTTEVTQQQQCISVNLNLLIYPSFYLFSLLVTLHLSSISVNLFLFCIQIHLYYFLYSTYK